MKQSTAVREGHRPVNQHDPRLRWHVLSRTGVLFRYVPRMTLWRDTACHYYMTKALDVRRLMSRVA